MKIPEGCMKQIDVALSSALSDKAPPPSQKWKGFINWTGQTYILSLYHYHHLVLQYDLFNHIILHEWWERPADKRGLDSAKIWLEARRNRFTEKEDEKK